MADTMTVAMANEKKMSSEVMTLWSTSRALVSWLLGVFMNGLEQTPWRFTRNENAETYLLFGAERPSSFFAYQSAIRVVVVRVMHA